jgi:hypothetical protein
MAGGLVAGGLAAGGLVAGGLVAGARGAGALRARRRRPPRAAAIRRGRPTRRGRRSGGASVAWWGGCGRGGVGPPRWRGARLGCGARAAPAPRARCCDDPSRRWGVGCRARGTPTPNPWRRRRPPARSRRGSNPTRRPHAGAWDDKVRRRALGEAAGLRSPMVQGAAAARRGWTGYPGAGGPKPPAEFNARRRQRSTRSTRLRTAPLPPHPRPPRTRGPMPGPPRPVAHAPRRASTAPRRRRCAPGSCAARPTPARRLRGLTRGCTRWFLAML